MDADWWVVAQDCVRVLVIGTGITLAMVAVRFAWLAHRRGETFRVLGILSFGFLVLTPALSGLTRFHGPLNWPVIVTYVAGLVLALGALRANYTIAPTWWRLSGRAKAASDEKRARRARR